MDRLRFELDGALTLPDSLDPGVPNTPSIQVFTYNANGTFTPAPYIAIGYNKFDVICIGGSGGQGGGSDGWLTNNDGTVPASASAPAKVPGGAGGGGGIQRVSGLLSALPSSCAVVVGAAGAPGANGATSSTASGADGGASSFAGTLCRASGGKAGSNGTGGSGIAVVAADGGDGGIGGTTVAGGGGTRGKASPVTNAVSGIWTPGTGIGSGGGGGSGGSATYPTAAGPAVTTQTKPASNGGDGAFNAADLSVWAPGSPAQLDPHPSTTNVGPILPGAAGGAKSFPISGLQTAYGDSAVLLTDPGIHQLAPHSGILGVPGVVVLRISRQ